MLLLEPAHVYGCDDRDRLSVLAEAVSTLRFNNESGIDDLARNISGKATSGVSAQIATLYLLAVVHSACGVLRLCRTVLVAGFLPSKARRSE